METASIASPLPWFRDKSFPLYLAPMAGYTDSAFRHLCKVAGADVMVTEFVLADSLLTDRPKVWETVDFTESQRPMGVQIFGADPRVMAEAAKRIASRLRPDFIDINYGCPSPRICSLNAGSSLLKDLPKMALIAAAVVEAVPDTPVTAKIRIGWDDSSIVAPEAARMLECAGIAAIAVHGRTKEQGYSGDANWQVIKDVVDAVHIPVIGNGNIRDADDIRRVEHTGVQGLMIGRAALGNPWVFTEIRETLRTGVRPKPPSMHERWSTILNYAQALQNLPNIGPQNGEPDRIHWMRSRLKFFIRDVRNSRRVRVAIEKAETIADLRALAGAYCEESDRGV